MARGGRSVAQGKGKERNECGTGQGQREEGDWHGEEGAWHGACLCVGFHIPQWQQHDMMWAPN